MKLVLIAIAILLMVSGSQGFAFCDSSPVMENGTIIVREYSDLGDLINQNHENGSIVISIGEF